MNLKYLNSLALTWCFLSSISVAHAFTVVLDTGHSPQRAGSRGSSGRMEYDYNLQVTNYISEYLAQQGVKVLRTSANGQDISLLQRVADTDSVDLFVSIHHDSIQQSWIDQGLSRQYRGYSVFVSKKNPKYQASLACAKRIGGSLVGVSERPSLYHSVNIKGENRPFIDERLGIHQYDDLVVLKAARSPSVLVEIGVIANPEEERRLANPNVQRLIAKALATAIASCSPDQR